MPCQNSKPISYYYNLATELYVAPRCSLISLALALLSQAACVDGTGCCVLLLHRHRQGEYYLLQGDIERAYVVLKKFATLFLKTITVHNAFQNKTFATVCHTPPCLISSNFGVSHTRLIPCF
jgi:hypothetical protein